MPPRLLIPIAASLLIAAVAHGQAFNIDFGVPGSGPSPSYAAAGLAGVWNIVGEQPPAERQALFGLDGAPTSGAIRQVGATTLLGSDDPSTSGDDEALIDDMILSFNDPLDACYWIDGLENGDYRVLIYALTPNQPTLLCRVRVDFATPGPTMIGGAWSGQHVEGTSYQSFTVTVTTGEIGLHSGLPGGEIQSGMNGIQILPLDAAALDEALAPAVTTLRVFPNPAGTAQSFALAGATGRTTVQIFDVLGRLVWEQTIEPAGGQAMLTWNGRDLRGNRVAAAPYVARIAGAGGERSVKVLRLQ